MGDDAMDYTPQRLLEEALRDFNKESKDAALPLPFDRPPDKLLIIGLWDDGGEYTTRFYNAGMKMSECMALCAFMQQRFYEIITEPHDE